MVKLAINPSTGKLGLTLGAEPTPSACGCFLRPGQSLPPAYNITVSGITDPLGTCNSECSYLNGTFRCDGSGCTWNFTGGQSFCFPGGLTFRRWYDVDISGVDPVIYRVYMRYSVDYPAHFAEFRLEVPAADEPLCWVQDLALPFYQFGGTAVGDLCNGGIQNASISITAVN